MEITLEQSLASIVRYLQNHTKFETDILFDEIPENFAVPTLYFQTPRSKSRKATLSAWETTFTMRCWFMCLSSQEAYLYAASARDSILLDNCVIPIMEKDGTLAGGGVRVSDLEVSNINAGVEQLTLSFRDYFIPDKDRSVKIQKFSFNGLIPPDAAYLAWKKAADQIKREEEAQKECLNRVMDQL